MFYYNNQKKYVIEWLSTCRKVQLSTCFEKVYWVTVCYKVGLSVKGANWTNVNLIILSAI